MSKDKQAPVRPSPSESAPKVRQRPSLLRTDLFHSHEPSTAARLLARQVLPLLPPEAIGDVRVYLEERVSEIPPAATRWARVELLVTMIRETGEWPAPEDYRARRRAEEERDALYPSVNELITHYLGWSEAVKEALRLLRRGSAGRGKSSHRDAGPLADNPSVGELLPDHVLSALEEYRRKLHEWPPDDVAFYDFCRQRRDAFLLSPHKRRGETRPPCPNPKQLRRLFGTYDAALWRAQEDWKRREGAHSSQGGSTRKTRPASRRAVRRRQERKRSRRRDTNVRPRGGR